ncbi:YqgE/AlgH family protein [Sulfitobacter sp. HNIBRBA2951]|uniref:YqgE/AlgH family protein n=1 Tax=Sulfitobacter aquimarinus TaxID=3158557 RepID=UPI0032DF3AD5
MDLTGQLLIAMPGMGDPRFDRSVVLICTYSDEGAMGIILNKPVPDMRLREVLDRMDMDAAGGPLDAPVHIGGPVQTERGFVLHTDKTRLPDKTMLIPGGYVMSVTQDVLHDIGAARGPDPFLFALGYSGWGPAQLDGEIAANGWLTAPASHDLVFGTQAAQLWEAALRSIGIDPVSLSGAAGRA